MLVRKVQIADTNFAEISPATEGTLQDVLTAINAGIDGAILDGVSSAIKATVLDYTNSNPLAVRLTDTAGDYVGAGAGTQYTEDAAAAANPIGTAVNLIRQDTPGTLVTTDGDNVSQRGTNYGAGYVQVVTSAGAFVDTFGGGTQYADGAARGTATGTLAMGDDGTLIQSIHVDASGDLQVDVLTMPTVAVTGTFWQATQPVSGTFWQATQPVSATDLDIRNLVAATDIVDLGGNALTSLQLIDNAVSGAGFNITQFGGAAVPIGAGLEVTALRVTIATDSTGVVSIDDNGGAITVDGTVAVTGTFWQATQPVSNAGTFAVQDSQDVMLGTDFSGVLGAASLILATQADDLVNTTDTLLTSSFLYGFDGTTWDRLKGDSTDGLLVNLGTNNDVTVTGSVTANAGTNLNTSLLALETGGNLAAAVTSLGIMDDWDNTASDGASVSGDVAHDGVDAGEPVKIGGKATSTTPTAVAANDRVNAYFDLSGYQYVKPAIPEQDLATEATVHVKKYYTNAGAVTDGIVWSPAAGKRWFVTDIFLNVSAAATVTLEDDLAAGDSAVWKAELAANSGWSHSFNTPLYSGEDAADLLITTSAGNVYVTVTGYEI